ncbi:MAG: pyrroline-5-carboxylate reductase [Candidatus Brockarchaeota archaeon]|nr:pyrroline-5-carboxylate reductase [Candidatus Brockarchaeota archaeon]
MKVGIIGAGVMGSSIAKRLLAKGVVTAEEIFVSDVDEGKWEKLAKEAGVATFKENPRVAREAEVLMLCVKPQQMAEALASLKPFVTPDHLVISIAAGVKTGAIEKMLAEGARVVRAMPNQCCLIGLSATAFSPGRNATKEDLSTAERIFSSFGKAYLVDEEMLDAVTGLSGSGPAYAYMAIEAMAEGGVEAGLPREVAVALAAQTLLGAASMVLETKRSPEELRKSVATPGGTTEAGIRVLEGGGFKGLLAKAVAEAAKRSKELSSKYA